MLTSRIMMNRGLLRSSNVRLLTTNLPVTAKTSVHDDGNEVAVSSVAEKSKRMRQDDAFLVKGPTGEGVPAPILPEDPSELSYMDPADLENEASRFKMDGSLRKVVIRQEPKSARQAPIDNEYFWHIKFDEDGSSAENWNNSLMGWRSSGDPYQTGPPLQFNNAAEAVYFAKKRGWKYVVEEPIMRIMGDLEQQYQDNFLPQAIAAQVKTEGINCRHWERSAAGSSHYFRPLKYHGDGTVRQHGANREGEIAQGVPGYYKKR